MPKLLIPLMLLLPLGAVAKDCVFSNKVTLKAGATKSLYDAPKGSLQTHKMQDQDLLGTCYANAGSVALKSVLDGNPDISYVHAGFVAAQNSSQEWKDGKGKYIVGKQQDEKGKDVDEDFTSGGSTCQMVEQLKKHKGACPKSFSLIENHDILNARDKSKAVWGLGNYFDNLNHLRRTNDTAGLEKLKGDTTKVMDKLKVKFQEWKKTCDEDRAGAPVYSAAKEMLNFAAGSAYAGQSNPCKESIIAAVKSLSSPESKFEKDRHEIRPSDTLLKALREKISGDPALNEQLTKFYQKDNDKFQTDEERATSKLLSKKVHEVLLAKVPAEGLKACESDPNFEACAKNKSLSCLAGANEGGTFMKKGWQDKKSDCSRFMDGRVAEAVAADKDLQKECSEPNLKLLLEALTPLVAVGAAIDEKLKTALLDAPPKQKDIAGPGISTNQLQDIIAPGCSDSVNLIPMDKVTCVQHSLCDENLPGVNVYKGPTGSPKDDNANTVWGKKKCYAPAEATKVFRSTALSAIEKNEAFAIAVCGSWLTDPSKKTNHCNTESEDGSDPAMHSMTITGISCSPNGKLRYEITNSWGKGCLVGVKEGEPGDTITCGKDEKGFNNGKIYVDEDSIVDATVQMDIIKKGK